MYGNHACLIHIPSVHAHAIGWVHILNASPPPIVKEPMLLGSDADLDDQHQGKKLQIVKQPSNCLSSVRGRIKQSPGLQADRGLSLASPESLRLPESAGRT